MCCILAAKWLDDDVHTNKHWETKLVVSQTDVAIMTVKAINRLELEQLSLLDFCMAVNKEDICEYVSRFRGHFNAKAASAGTTSPTSVMDVEGNTTHNGVAPLSPQFISAVAPKPQAQHFSWQEPKDRFQHQLHAAPRDAACEV